MPFASRTTDSHRATVARHLLVKVSVLPRSKRDAAEDHNEPLAEPSDLDVFPEDAIEAHDEADNQDEEGPEGENRTLGLLAAVPGPLIAAATFFPTFLAIFFGLSYVVGALQPGSTANAPVPSATALVSDGPKATPPISESLRDPFVAPRAFDSPASKPDDPRPRESFRPPSVVDLPTPAIESPAATLPPAQPRTALIPAPESRSGRVTEPPRQPEAAVLNTTPERTPAADNRKGGREWTPAAAFTDREAAGRLASSIQQQGYPVEIRQESSSSRPWVVWIGAQPRRRTPPLEPGR